MFLPVPVQMMRRVDVAAFRRLLAELKPVLVILDTQARVTVGAEENSSRDMGEFVDGLEQLRQQCGACVLVVHHEPRNGENLRGSTALEGAATTILRVSKDGDLVTLSNPKQKDAPEQPDLPLALVPIGESAVLDSQNGVGIASHTTKSEDHLLTLLGETYGNREVAKTGLRCASDLPDSTFYRSINSLVSKGLVRERPRGFQGRTHHHPGSGSVYFNNLPSLGYGLFWVGIAAAVAALVQMARGLWDEVKMQKRIRSKDEPEPARVTARAAPGTEKLEKVEDSPSSVPQE